MSASSTRFDELRALAAHKRVGFQRDIFSEITDLGDESIMVYTRLLDEYHDLSTVMVVGGDLIISDFEVRMDRMPYELCPESFSAYQSLVGLYVFQRGVLREMKSRVERTAGCTHITELLEASLRALFAGLYNVRREVDLSKILTKDELRQLNILRPVLADTCRSFRKSDANEEMVFVALEKIKAAGHDPQKLDPHRSSVG